MKGPLEGRGKKYKTLSEECGGRSYKGPVYQMVKSRGSKSLFLREGLLLFLLSAPTSRSTSWHHILHCEDGGTKVLQNVGILV
jgi:hypothetical protein